MLSNERILDLISTMNESNCKNILNKIQALHREDSKNTISLLFSYINRLSSNDISQLTSNLDQILNFIKQLENSTPILFLLLESFASKKDEIYRFSVLEVLRHETFGIANIIDLLFKNDTEFIILDVLRLKPVMIDEFIRETIKIDNSVASKNIGQIFPVLDISYFLNYKSFLFLFEREHHYLRNCFIDIVENLILYYKDQSNLEAISELTLLLYERLIDVNFYVRNRALGAIANLFKSEAILKDQRNVIIKEIMERAKDKTVIVRKRSINLLSQILLNHPFKNRTNLLRTEDEPELGSNQTNMNLDFEEFTTLMENTLQIVVSLLDDSLKTDILEISTFIKIAYLLRLKGSKQAIYKILGVVFTKDKNIVIDIFKEILLKRGEILYEFINDKAFEIILQSLDIDEKMLFKNVYEGEKVFESIYILKQLKRHISEQNAMMLLNHMTSMLFSSSNEEELNINVKSYINTLCIIKNLRYRIEHNHEIFNLVIKNTIKMVFYEVSLIKMVVNLIYSTSVNPEATVSKLLKNLCLSKSSLKILDSIGWIALNQYYLQERFEKKSKGIKVGDLSNAVLVDGSSLREKRKSLEEIRRNSLGGMSSEKQTIMGDMFRLSLKLDDLEETLKNKSEEEIADFFFYLKETEILYSKTSMLHQFIPFLKESLRSQNSDIQTVAYSSLFKCMLISSTFFSENFNYIGEALDHPNNAVKNIAVVALHDFIIFYNSYFENSILFSRLSDPEINKNVLLIIFGLLQKNIIRVKNNSVKILNLLFDERLGNIVRTIIRTFSTNNNIISVMFFEAYTSELSIEHLKFLAYYVGSNIQESMFLKCLKSGMPKDRLKVVFNVFDLGEKFIKDNAFRDEIRELIEVNL